MPVSAIVGLHQRDGHHVADSHGHRVGAARAEVGLGGLIGLDRANLDEVTVVLDHLGGPAASPGR